MKLFIDTANLADIETALCMGVRGVTTNPSLLAKEPKSNYAKHMMEIVKLCKKYGDSCSLSVEVFSNDEKEIVRQAKEFVNEIKYKNLAIKIPIGFEGQNNLSVIKELAQSGIQVNATACMTALQLLLSAEAGARYVSLFYNRLRDSAKESGKNVLITNKVVRENDFDPNVVLSEARTLLESYPEVEIIAGSIRTPLDVKEAGLAGAHIVTASLAIIKQSLAHFKTDHAVEQFLNDFKTWTS